MSLHQEMRDAGLVVGHHESDLYVKNCQAAWDILARYPIAKANAERFTSETGEGPCLDIPFMYEKELGDAN